MYYFKKSEKAKALDGRTITWIAKNRVYISPNFLSAIFTGRRGCSYRTAMIITNAICREAKLDDYFYEDNKKPMYIKIDKDN